MHHPPDSFLYRCEWACVGLRATRRVHPAHNPGPAVNENQVTCMQACQVSSPQRLAAAGLASNAGLADHERAHPAYNTWSGGMTQTLDTVQMQSQ